ncbi:hypothetical protein D3C87_1515860 [compost metagenome]
MQHAVAAYRFQFFQAGADASGAGAPVEGVAGVVPGFDGVARVQGGGRVVVNVDFAGGVAQRIQRQIASDAVHPAASRSARCVERVGLVPDLDEGVMHDVLCPSAIAQESLGHAQQARAFLPIQRFQRGPATGRARLQGSFVIEIRGQAVRHARAGTVRERPRESAMRG